ncbi:MAG: hypothetical protein GEV08_24670 [Acidimicrobiia bacterium]|nr:hypothetical protein [Acidimicrobiia bacterium]
MPIFGRADVDALLPTAPVIAGLRPAPWELPEAELLQATFEVVEDPALTLTPPALHPSIPPYAAFNVTRFPDTPVGPFTLAQVRLVCRAGIRPRGYLLGAVCDSPDAVAALRSAWGYRVGLGEVVLSQRHDRVRGTVAVGGRTIMDLTMEDGEPIGSSDLQLVANLHLVRESEEDRAGVLIQVDPEYAIHSAERGRPELAVYDGEAWGTGGGLDPHFPIVAFTCTADTDLPAMRFTLDPRRPAFEGTRRIEVAA